MLESVELDEEVVGGARDLLVYVNGELVPSATASVSVFDSGLNFGDGVFEGLRVYDGKVFRLEAHIDRLYASARALSLSIPMTRAALAEEILAWLRVNEIRDAFHFRPIVTRGPRKPPRVSPAFAQSGATILIVGADIAPPDSAAGLRVIFASVRRPGPDVLDAKIKSLNFGNNVMARLEAFRAGVDDALVLDGAGFLAEATSSNVFIVERSRLVTPYPKACLAGITRNEVMRLATESGIEVIERDISRTDVINADEVFATGTGAHVAPIVEVDGNMIGEGCCGRVTAQLRGLYDRVVADLGDPI